jgi:divalent metal cation (Fe/Co/Zn/Cd) transporter
VSTAAVLLRRGLRLEYATLAWNVVGVGILVVLAVQAGSTSLAGFGLDSLIEIAASVVVVWELSGAPERRERIAMRLIGIAFAVLVVYLLVQIAVVVATGVRSSPSPLGIVWTAATFGVMLALAAGKLRTGAALGNPVLQTEGRVTLVDAYLAAAVLIGLVLNGALGWWWADPLAGLVIVCYGAREAMHALRHRAG